jgi:DNA-binding NtrC family response regulator
MQLSNTMEAVFSNNFVQESFGNRVEALRAVVMLLLREVDSLEKSIADEAKEMAETDYSLAEKLTKLEVDTIRCALIKTNGRQKPAAKLLGMKLTTLNAKIKKFDIDWRLPNTMDQLIG